MTATCLTGKRRYRDRIAAQLKLAAIRHGGGQRRRETRAYRCETCGGWHLTSQDARRP